MIEFALSCCQKCCMSLGVVHQLLQSIVASPCSEVQLKVTVSPTVTVWESCSFTLVIKADLHDSTAIDPLPLLRHYDVWGVIVGNN